MSVTIEQKLRARIEEWKQRQIKVKERWEVCSDPLHKACLESDGMALMLCIIEIEALLEE